MPCLIMWDVISLRFKTFHTECEYVKISSLSQYMDELYAFIKQEYTR